MQLICYLIKNQTNKKNIQNLQLQLDKHKNIIYHILWYLLFININLVSNNK